VLTKQCLVKIKVRALRRRVWFKALTKVERGIIDLTIDCVERVRSYVLLKILSGIVDKLMSFLEPAFLEKIEKIGRKIAEKICKVAKSWGNLRAQNWRSETNFIRYLGITVFYK
jgi:hypothetical protein